MVLGTARLDAQTCCSGGVPLASNLGLPAAERGTWQVGLQYDYNRLTRLYAGSDRFREADRQRVTHTAILNAGYALGERWQAELQLPYVGQRRNILNTGNGRSRTRGIGDAVVLLRHRVLGHGAFAPWQWSVGLGTKLPTGAADRRNDDDITLNADLQPGSGAWDLILWQRLSHQLRARPSVTVYVQAVHRRRGVNDAYLPVTDPLSGDRRFQTYQFGRETQVQGGIADRIAVGGRTWEPGLSLIYRHAGADRTNDVVTPSTGGDFLFGQFTLALLYSPRTRVRAAFDLPLLNNVTGTQLAPTYRANVGIFLTLAPQNTSSEP